MGLRIRLISDMLIPGRASTPSSKEARTGGAVAFNVHNEETKGPHGGMGAMTFGMLSNYAKGDAKCDPTGLGRWVSIVLKCEAKVVRFAAAYRAIFSSRLRRRGPNSNGGTTWEQY